MLESDRWHNFCFSFPPQKEKKLQSNNDYIVSAAALWSHLSLNFDLRCDLLHINHEYPGNIAVYFHTFAEAND